MVITREKVIHDLADKSGYYMKDIRSLLLSLDDLIEDYYSEASEKENLSIQLIRGVKIGCKVLPERERVDPRDGHPIIVKPTCKPFVKFSENFKENIQNKYEKSLEDG